MPKGKQGFQKNHKPFKGIEKGWFKKGQKPKFTSFVEGCKGYWAGKKRPEISKLKKGIKRSQETKDKISNTLKGRKLPKGHPFTIKGNIPWNKDIPCSEETKRKISDNGKGIKKPTISKLMKGKRGRLAHNWQGGKISLAERMRKYPEYKEWRKKVFKFDDYTCWICENRGGELHPHHLMRLSLYPELAFKLSNGLTICKFCHKTYTNFGRNNKQIKNAKNN